MPLWISLCFIDPSLLGFVAETIVSLFIFFHWFCFWGLGYLDLQGIGSAAALDKRYDLSGKRIQMQ